MKKITTYLLTGMIALSSLSSAKNELSSLTESSKIWNKNARNFANQNKWLDWEKGNAKAKFVYESRKLTLWGESVEAIKLMENKGSINELHFEILNQDSSMLMSNGEFGKKAAYWKKLLDAKFGSKAITVSSYFTGKVKHSRLAWKYKGDIVVLSANIGVRPDRLVLSMFEEKAGLASFKLEGQQDKKFIANLKKEEREAKQEEKEEIAASGIDPNASEEVREIQSTILEIKARVAPKGISKEVQDAINLLNVYRFLSSVPYNVKADKSMIRAAEDAASICKVKGTLSHGFGHSTDKCNLAMNSSHKTVAPSVTQYMNDAGANNRDKRGHRRWCLNHKMGKSGFGIDGAFSAMYSLDQSGKSIRKNYSYPGHDLYPIEYLHGNGWSYHLVNGKAPGKCNVQVWRLNEEEDKLPSWSTEPEGTKLPCKFVNTYGNTIVFEPASEPVTTTGYYLVRLKGGDFKEQYLVKLY